MLGRGTSEVTGLSQLNQLFSIQRGNMENSIVKFKRQHLDKIYQIQLAQMERRMMWAVQEVIDSISLECQRVMFEESSEY